MNKEKNIIIDQTGKMISVASILGVCILSPRILSAENTALSSDSYNPQKQDQEQITIDNHAEYIANPLGIDICPWGDLTICIACHQSDFSICFIEQN